MGVDLPDGLLIVVPGRSLTSGGATLLGGLRRSPAGLARVTLSPQGLLEDKDTIV